MGHSPPRKHQRPAWAQLSLWLMETDRHGVQPPAGTGHRQHVQPGCPASGFPLSHPPCSVMPEAELSLSQITSFKHFLSLTLDYHS